MTQTHNWLAVSEKLRRCSQTRRLAQNTERGKTALRSARYSEVKYLFCTKLCITVAFTFQYCCDAAGQLQSDGSPWQEERKIFRVHHRMKAGVFENWCYSFIQHQGSVELDSQTSSAVINGNLDLLFSRQERQGFSHLFKALPFADFLASLLLARVSCSSYKLVTATPCQS